MAQIFEILYVIKKCLEKYELVFSSTFIFQRKKNELKIFLPTETYEKGG